jgi:hypothetical protein
MLWGTLSLTQFEKIKAVNGQNLEFSGDSNILKFLLSPVRLTKCLGVRVPLRPPRKKALIKTNHFML